MKNKIRYMKVKGKNYNAKKKIAHTHINEKKQWKNVNEGKKRWRRTAKHTKHFHGNPNSRTKIARTHHIVN